MSRHTGEFELFAFYTIASGKAVASMLGQGRMSQGSVRNTLSSLARRVLGSFG